jgi:hypothetical protein
MRVKRKFSKSYAITTGVFTFLEVQAALMQSGESFLALFTGFETR